jgi:hypothetical protein
MSTHVLPRGGFLVDPRKAAGLINPIDYDEVLSKHVPNEPVESTPKWERLFKASVIMVCGWALVEAPLELSGPIDSSLLLAVVATKVLICLIGMAAVANLHIARRIFTFICGASVFAIATALPLEYTRCVSIAIFSTVECIGKAACVALFAIASFTSGSVSARPSLPSRRATDQT